MSATCVLRKILFGTDPKSFAQLFDQSLQNGGKNDAAAVYGM